MTLNDLYACWSLDQRCFQDAEVYDLSTFRMLLSNPDSVSFKIVDENGEMQAFLVGMIDRASPLSTTGSGHVIAVGVAPEARRRGYGRRLMRQTESAFAQAGVTIVHLEVRVTNFPAYMLYTNLGYIVTEHKTRYYANGEDGYKMVKAINTGARP